MGEAPTVFDLKREIKRCTDCDQRFGPEATFCPFDGTVLRVANWDPSGDALLGIVVEGRYEVCSVLGEGGMGTVYKVRHTALERHFAMKVLRKDLACEADLAGRFIQEARATASIKHPNVVAITDFGHLPDETPYFVMELLGGQPLSAAIRAAGVMDPAQAVKILLKIAAGLGAAHDAGIVHRDLKPENVFLVPGATGGLVDDVRIVDFGAAKVMGASRMTKAGIVFGTPHYMSPEQAAGEEVDLRTDVYALGVIMYEMFTGRVPFEADTYMGVLTQHMFVNPAPPSQVVPERAKELGALEDLTLRALEKKADLRFASMHDLRREVERLARFDADGHLLVSPAGSGARSSSASPRRSPPRPFLLPSEREVDVIAGAQHGAPRVSAVSWVALGLAACALGLFAWSRAEHHSEIGDGERPSMAAAPAPPRVPALTAAPVEGRPASSFEVRPAFDAQFRAGPDQDPTSPTSSANPASKGSAGAGRAPGMAATPPPSTVPPPVLLGSDFTDPWKK